MLKDERLEDATPAVLLTLKQQSARVRTDHRKEQCHLLGTEDGLWLTANKKMRASVLQSQGAESFNTESRKGLEPCRRSQPQPVSWFPLGDTEQNTKLTHTQTPSSGKWEITNTSSFKTAISVLIHLAATEHWRDFDMTFQMTWREKVHWNMRTKC